MSYKYKKIPQKQKKSHLITDELIKDKRFAEIVKKFNEKSDLSNRDRYIYGYALLKMQQYLEALVNLWPLAAKGHTKLQEDCAVIAAHVFTDKDRLWSADLSDDKIYTLFLAGKNLVSQSVAYHALKQRLFNTLWQQGRFEKLEQILKSSKEESLGLLVENLSKLDFFQPNRKFVGNIPAFVGHILTGGACLIARDSVYHSDIEKGIRLLANEIKYLFYQLKIKNQPLTWDRMLFENFVDYEANILIHVLQMVVKNSSVHFDIIPTPSYLMYYDATAKRVDEKFLSWLAAENKELFETYNADTYYAVLWALGGEKTPYSNKLLKSAHKDKFSPYLDLAILLRSVAMKKSPLGELGRLSVNDFADLKQPMSVFKEVVVQTVKSIVDNPFHTKLTIAFWKMLFEFYPVLQDPDCRNILTMRLIEKLEKEYAEQLNLDVTSLKNIAQQIGAHDLAKQAEILCDRQHACMGLLLNLKDKKRSKKIIKNIKDVSTLRAHLTLIADCCFLLYTELPMRFFEHIECIVQNNEINKFIPLIELFDCEFDCTCASCKQMQYRVEIPSIAKELNLPVVSIQNIRSCAYTPTSSKAQAPRSIILSQADPFKALGVSLTDSKQIIMQKVMQLIQQSPGQMAIYRQAQSELFNPAQRFLHQYLRYLNCEDNSVGVKVQQTLPPTNYSLHEIPLRHEFLDEN